MLGWAKMLPTLVNVNRDVLYTLRIGCHVMIMLIIIMILVWACIATIGYFIWLLVNLNWPWNRVSAGFWHLWCSVSRFSYRDRENYITDTDRNTLEVYSESPLCTSDFLTIQDNKQVQPVNLLRFLTKIDREIRMIRFLKTGHRNSNMVAAMTKTENLPILNLASNVTHVKLIISKNE